jgi:hypothetical protein
MRRDEENKLDPWLWAFEQVFGEAPRLAPWTHSSCPDGALYQLNFPAVFDPPELAGRPGHFDHMPQMVEVVKNLGFDWPDGAFIHVMPTPESFNDMLRSSKDSDGYELAYLKSDSEMLPTGPWLDMYLHGKIPIHVASEAFYEKKISSAREPGSLGALQFHLVSAGHDLSVHALNYHLIPQECIRAFREKIFETIPNRASQWSSGQDAPLTLTFFLDNDLNRFCYAVWCRSATSEQFKEIFRANLHQLMAVLETRLEETRAGKGDVASGDTNDMPELVHTEFQIA